MLLECAVLQGGGQLLLLLRSSIGTQSTKVDFCSMRRFWRRFTRIPDRSKEVQLLSVNGTHLNGIKTRNPAADPELGAKGQGRSPGVTAPLATLERESMSPAAGLRQEKVPMSDDPFWDGA